MRACADRFLDLIGLALLKVLIKLKSNDCHANGYQKNRYDGQMAKFKSCAFY